MPKKTTQRRERGSPLGTISLKPEIWKRLDIIAGRWGQTRSATIARLVLEAEVPAEKRTGLT